LSQDLLGVPMEKLSSYLGFEARYIVFPLIVLLIGRHQLIVHRYARQWLRNDKPADNQIVAHLDTMTIRWCCWGSCTVSALASFAGRAARVFPEGSSGSYCISGRLFHIPTGLINLLFAGGAAKPRGSSFTAGNLQKCFCSVIAIAITIRILDITVSDIGSV